MIANLLVILTFATTIFAPVIWFMFQSETEQPAPTSMLQLGTAVFAFVPTLITLPLCPNTHRKMDGQKR